MRPTCTGIDIAGTLASTQYSTGNGSQTQMRQSVSCMHFSAGSVISITARMVSTAQALDTRACLSHSGSGGILFCNRRRRQD
ncbi:uncharacterized protein ASPGLDRAFT_43446 [Aspergillus glaucus CBS 516.65]|uniref:Uncharacterized protein n=1 Tax=Aspergillus glaucus CBS 516.65 TaxID=1160497 RepID=A0A1L9VSU7_ASPGL|nr:hypothetical protein ASPGLDRAFT_43446 [Aspergillus glaucus CBS 516.65]OJJ86972.1 hypothetical protein ASPGLDRAFT_43446 [Aspergillus glaucus CBS 516.65]